MTVILKSISEKTHPKAIAHETLLTFLRLR
jgi:hypothetical protein